MDEKLKVYQEAVDKAKQELADSINEVREWQKNEETVNQVDFDRDFGTTMQSLKNEIDASVVTDYNVGFLRKEETDKDEALKFTSITPEQLEKLHKENIDKVNDIYKTDIVKVMADPNSEYSVNNFNATIKAGEVVVVAIQKAMERNLEAVCKKNATLSKDMGYVSDQDFIDAVVNSYPLFDGINVNKEPWKDDAKAKYNDKIIRVYNSVVTGKPEGYLDEDVVKFINSAYIAQNYKGDDKQLKEEGQKVLRGVYTAMLNNFSENSNVADDKLKEFKVATGLELENVAPSVDIDVLREKTVNSYLDAKMKEYIVADILQNPIYNNTILTRRKVEKSYDQNKDQYLAIPEYVSKAVYSIVKDCGMEESTVDKILKDSAVNGKITAENWKEAGRIIVEQGVKQKELAESVAVSRKQLASFEDVFENSFYILNSSVKKTKEAGDKALTDGYLEKVYNEIVKPTIVNYGDLESLIINNIEKSNKIIDPIFWEKTFAKVNVNVAKPIQNYDDSCVRYTFANLLGADFNDRLQQFVLEKDKETLSKETRGFKGVYDRLVNINRGADQEKTNLLTNKAVREQAIEYLDEFIEKEKTNRIAEICVATAKNLGVENQVEFAQNMCEQMVEKLKKEHDNQIEATKTLENGGAAVQFGQYSLEQYKEYCDRRYLVDTAVITADMFEDKKQVEEKEKTIKETTPEKIPEEAVNEQGEVIKSTKQPEPQAKKVAEQQPHTVETVVENAKTFDELNQENEKQFKNFAAPESTLDSISNIGEFYNYWDSHYNKIAEGIKTRRPSLSKFDSLLNNEEVINSLANCLEVEVPVESRPENEEVKSNFVKWFDESIESRDENANYLNAVSRTKLFDDNKTTDEEKMRHINCELQDRIARNADKLLAERQAIDETYAIADLSAEDKANVVFKSKCQIDAKNRLYSRVLDKNKQFEQLPTPKFNIPTVSKHSVETPKNCIPTTYSSAEAQEKYMGIVLKAMEKLAPNEILNEVNNQIISNAPAPETLEDERFDLQQPAEQLATEKLSEELKPAEQLERPETKAKEQESEDVVKETEPENEYLLTKQQEEMLAGSKTPLGVHDLAVDALYIDMYEHIKNLTEHTRQPNETDDQYFLRDKNAKNYKNYIGQHSLDILKMAAYGERAFLDENNRVDKDRVDATYAWAQKVYEDIHENDIIRNLIAKSGKDNEYNILNAAQRKDWVEKNIKTTEEYKIKKELLKDQMDKMFDPDTSKSGFLCRRGLMRTVVQDMTKGKYNVSNINLDDNSIKDEYCKNTRLYNATMKANFSFAYDDYVKSIQKTIAGANVNYQPFQGDNLSNAKWESGYIECFDVRTPDEEYKQEGVDYGVSRTTLPDGTQIYLDNATKTIIDVSLNSRRRKDFLDNVVNSVNIENAEYDKNNLNSALNGNVKVGEENILTRVF